MGGAIMRVLFSYVRKPHMLGRPVRYGHSANVEREYRKAMRYEVQA